ncbi:MAG: diaminopimelate epimerase [Nanoarchaeota archaeon]
MKFTKMHGTGNDYFYINGFEETVSNPSKLAIKLSDRHFGIGGDGLILILPSKIADVRMQMFNADGSEGAMCGNGIRCVAKYAYEHSLAKKEKMTIETKSGIKSLELSVKNGKVDSVTVDMGEAVVGKEVAVTIDGKNYTYLPVNVGNPHAVLFVDKITDELVLGVGPKIEKHPNFQDRTNVEFVKAKNRKELDFRVWERGSGETMACGTGACAAVAAGITKGVLDKKVTVHLKGGDLQIELKNNHVFMTGNAVNVFEGEI